MRSQAKTCPHTYLTRAEASWWNFWGISLARRNLVDGGLLNCLMYAFHPTGAGFRSWCVMVAESSTSTGRVNQFLRRLQFADKLPNRQIVVEIRSPSAPNWESLLSRWAVDPNVGLRERSPSAVRVSKWPQSTGREWHMIDTATRPSKLDSIQSGKMQLH